MNLDWQNITAILIVAGSLGYVAWRLWRAGTSKKGPRCAGCAACGPGVRQEQQLVSVEPPSERSDARRSG